MYQALCCVKNEKTKQKNNAVVLSESAENWPLHLTINKIKRKSSDLAFT